MSDIVERLTLNGYTCEFTPRANLLHEAAAEIKRLQTMLDAITHSGGHLANYLYNKLGPNFHDRFPPDADPNETIKTIPDVLTYEVWRCWAVIMLAWNMRRQNQT